MSTKKSDTAVLVDPGAFGQAVIPEGTQLSRLNYYDGKVLRAADMSLEQKYLMSLVALSNHSLSPGVVHGFDAALAGGDRVRLGGGLAIDPQGHPLLLPQAVTLSLTELIEASKPRSVAAGDTVRSRTGVIPGLFDGAPHFDRFSDCLEVKAPPATVDSPTPDLYVLAICRAEAFCGLEDVYGKLCEPACVTATQRPYVREGVVVRMIPLMLTTPFITSRVMPVVGETYLRSQVAHSFFADEVLRHPSSIHRTGLLSNVWCLGSQYDESCCEVPLAVVSRAGGVTRFLDPWIPRRERIDAPSKQNWQWRMRQRPWSVFLAQVLQFQCHLAHLFDELPEGEDPCAPAKDALRDTMKLLEGLKSSDDTSRALGLLNFSFTQLAALKKKLEGALVTPAGAPTSRIAIKRGMVELPPAGYLPVVKGARSVNAQVRALLGDGLDYRFCVVRPDFIGHAFEAAQHLDRISLLQGLDDPTDKPKLDVLVPDGRVVGRDLEAAGVFSAVLTVGSDVSKTQSTYQGVARELTAGVSGGALTAALGGASRDVVKKYVTFLQPWVAAKASGAAAPEVKVPSGTVVRGKAAPGFYRVPSDDLGALRATAARASWAGVASEPAAPRRAAGADSADAVWVHAETEADLRELQVGASADASCRFIWASLKPGTPPYSLEADFTGTVTNQKSLPLLAGQTRRYLARASGLVHLTVSYDSTDPAHPSERLLTFATRTSYEFEVSAGAGHAELTMRPNDHVRFELVRSAPGPNADVGYAVSVVVIDANGTEQRSDLAELLLKEDAQVLNPTQPDHVVAALALEVLQGTRLVTEPKFKAEAEAVLFPELALDDPGLIIEPTLDWCFFTRRRDKQCTRTWEPPPVQLVPRRYQVLNLTAENEDEAQKFLADITHPARGPLVLQRALKYSQPAAFIDFAGGSATGLFSPTDLLADWKAFGPPVGQEIYGVAWGAAGDDDAAIQGARLTTVETALAPASSVRPNPTNVALSPFPPALAVGGAEGFFLFVTLRQLTRLEVVELTAGEANRVETLRAAIGTANFQSVLNRMEPKYLGQAVYAGVAPQDGSVDAIAAAWVQNPPGESLLWTWQTDPALADEERAANAVAGAIHAARHPSSPQPGVAKLHTTSARPSLKVANRTLKDQAVLFIADDETAIDVVVGFDVRTGNLMLPTKYTVRGVTSAQTPPQAVTSPNVIFGKLLVMRSPGLDATAVGAAYREWGSRVGLHFRAGGQLEVRAAGASEEAALRLRYAVVNAKPFVVFVPE